MKSSPRIGKPGSCLGFECVRYINYSCCLRFIYIFLLTGCSLLPSEIQESAVTSDKPLKEQTESVKCPGETCEGFIEVSGGRVWYRMMGRGKPGIPLLVLHGGPGGTHDYLEILGELAHERPVVFYDQLGCGKSDHPDDKSLWTVERYTDEVEQVRSALGLTRMHVLGQSWGSMLAIEYYLKYPQYVAGMIFSGPAISAKRFVSDQKVWLQKMPAAARLAIEKADRTGNYDSKSYKDAVDSYYHRHVCQLSPWPDPLQRSMNQLNAGIYEYMWGPSEFRATGTLKDFDRTLELGRIAVPLLITCGDMDEASPRTCAMYSERAPLAEVVVFGEASHSHHLEHPEAYLRVVQRFLGKADRRQMGG